MAGHMGQSVGDVGQNSSGLLPMYLSSYHTRPQPKCANLKDKNQEEILIRCSFLQHALADGQHHRQQDIGSGHKNLSVRGRHGKAHQLNPIGSRDHVENTGLSLPRAFFIPRMSHLRYPFCSQDMLRSLVTAIKISQETLGRSLGQESSSQGHIKELTCDSSCSFDLNMVHNSPKPC